MYSPLVLQRTCCIQVGHEKSLECTERAQDFMKVEIKHVYGNYYINNLSKIF